MRVRGPRAASGLTLIELLVVIAVTGLLAALLFPVLAVAREQGRSVTCLSNVKQLGLVFEMYCADSDGWYPPALLWKSRLQDFLATPDMNRCPSRPDLPWYYGQGYNVGCPSPFVPGFADRRQTDIVRPAEKILEAEWDRCNAGPPCGRPGLFADGATCFWAVCRIHRGGSNVLFGDGQAKWVRPEQYHSTTDHVDEAGHPVPEESRAVAETVWRRYWDTSYDGV